MFRQDLYLHRANAPAPRLRFTATAALASVAALLCANLGAQAPVSSTARSARNVVRASTPARTAPFDTPFPEPTATPATLTGSVADPEGALVPGAEVVLYGPGDDLADEAGHASGHPPHQTETTDTCGHFRFNRVLPGTYTISVSAGGFERLRSPGVIVRPGETSVPLALTLALLPNRADVTVTASRHDLASDEIHALEQQRVLGLFPDFYTSFAANPVPLDAGQKFSLALRATTDRMAFVTAGLVASGEQIQNTFPEWGTGRLGYARRYGAAYTDAFTGKILGAAVFPAIFRQDPRYFYMGSGTVKARARHAVLAAFLARGDSGRWQPNYSHILGNAAAGALSTTYHPAADSAGKLALSNALLGTLGEAGVNLTREFVFRRFIHGIQPQTNPATP